MMGILIEYLFGFFPPWFQAAIYVCLSIVVTIVALKIVKLVLDAIPLL